MKKYLFILILILAFVTFSSQSFAQHYMEHSKEPGETAGEPAKEKITRWRGSLDKIKAEISTLVRENNALDDQYQKLKKELIDLQDTINRIKLENNEIEKESVRTRKLLKNKEHKYDKLLLKEDKMKADLIEHQSKKEALESDLRDVEQAIKLWELQVSEMGMQKNELMLELKLQENKRADIQKGQAKVIRDLKDKLRAVQSEEKTVLTSIDQLNQKRLDILNDIKKTKEQNMSLREQIADLKVQKQNQIRNNKDLRTKYSKTVNSTDREYRNLLKERKRVETKVLGLEAKLDKVKKSIEDSMRMQEDKRGLINEIMRLDDENQELRNRISELQRDIDQVKQESSELEWKDN